jgi:choline-sulfatase
MRRGRRSKGLPLSRHAGFVAVLVAGALLAGCSDTRDDEGPSTTSGLLRPSVLLVTLDTTRADRLGIESEADDTPALDALAARGTYFSQAYSTVPMTLPAHVSMFTGRYPADHGVHENGRYIEPGEDLLAAALRARGYRTAAFISGYPLSSRFGIGYGFDHFDDEFGEGRAERDARTTTDRALAHLARTDVAPVFMWVHYFDPHEPYDPPEPFRSRHPDDLYQAEIAFMDSELGRLVADFERHRGDGDWRIVVVGDHGEGLGDHGEALHGKLLYQGVMRVPLIVAGSGLAAATRIDEPVSIRGAFDTILGWADGAETSGWMAGDGEPVLAEALKPYLQYGWQPQVMGVAGALKVIRSGETEVYDVRTDPEESRNLAGQVEVPRELAQAIREYPIGPTEGSSKPAELDEEAIRKLASLGYFDSGPAPGPRADAPNPKDMTHLFRELDLGSGLFVRGDYEKAAEVFRKVVEKDPGNFVVCLRLAVAYSQLGREEEAQSIFERAREINPDSVDLRHYHAMHYLRFGRLERAGTLFESVLVEMPRRLPALQAMARIELAKGALPEAVSYLDRVVAIAEDSVPELLQLGRLNMALQRTPSAIDAFERARRLQGPEFGQFLDLGVCYLAVGEYAGAAEALDQVRRDDPGYPIALFKRAQVAVLRREPDWRDRLRLAEQFADETTRPLIESEPLFRDAERVR